MANQPDIKVRLLNALIEDAAKPRKQIASDLGISESYVSKMVKELEYDEVILRNTIHANYRELGYSGHFTSVFTLSAQSQEAIEHLVSLLEGMPEAIEIASVYGGDGDIFVRWLCRDAEQLQNRIDSVLGSHEVKETRTTTLGKFYRREFGPKIEERGQ